MRWQSSAETGAAPATAAAATGPGGGPPRGGPIAGIRRKSDASTLPWKHRIDEVASAVPGSTSW